MEQNFLRKIVRSEESQIVIEIPDSLKNKNLELLLLPMIEINSNESEDYWETKYKNSFLYYMMTNPLESSLMPFTRNDIYNERLR